VNKKRSGEKILIAMSGGIDSSVAAALLKNQGLDLVAMHLVHCDSSAPAERRFSTRCCLRSSSDQVTEICRKFDIPLHVVSVAELFEAEVVDHFIHERLQMRSPNLCVPCNQSVRLKTLFEKARELGCARVATGLYAQSNEDMTTGIYRVYKASDHAHDQTFLMYGLTQETLKTMIFPLGGLTRSMVRKLAEEFGITDQISSEDSVAPCELPYPQDSQFLEQKIVKSLRSPGLIRSVEGDLLGEHKGLHQFSIGQKEGFELRNGEDKELCVVDFEVKSATLVVGRESDLYYSQLVAEHVNWIRPIDQLHGHKLKARLRQDWGETACSIVVFANDTVYVRFDEPRLGVIRGQTVAFYDGDELLGGGVITRIGVEALGIKEQLPTKDKAPPQAPGLGRF